MEDTTLELILSLNRDPMLVTEGGQVLCRNAAAEERFPELVPGFPVSQALPPHLLEELPDRLTTTALVLGAPCAVTAVERDGRRYFTLLPLGDKEIPAAASEEALAEMSNRLCNIILASEQLVQDADAPDRDSLLSILWRNGYIMKRQLWNLTAALQLQSGSYPFCPKRADLREMSLQVTDGVRHLARSFSGDVVCQCPDRSLWAEVDATLVYRLLLNLLVNSLENMPSGGKLLLRLEREGSSAVFTLTDTGSGMEPEVLRAAFGQDGEDDGQKELSYGAGLGLWLSTRIARLHGGTLLLESQPGRGTQVRILLPLELPESLRVRVDPEKTCRVAAPELRELLLTEMSELLNDECLDLAAQEW